MVAVPDLPAEVLALIFVRVSNRDIKNLRLANKFFHATAKLRLSRVFLSANPLNIEVFRAIADDDTFSHGIVEIIWDDARLKDVSFDPDSVEEDWYDAESSPLDEDDDTGNESQSDHGYEPRGIPRWFGQACRRNIEQMRYCDKDISSSGKNERATQLIFQLRFQKSWKQYRLLLRQQREVLSTDADAEAFRYGLQRFPSLKRVVVTPAAHGYYLFHPLYQTPMIRAFKYGFNYPIPRGWPTASRVANKNVLPWTPTRHRWRGVCIALRELARNIHHHVTEFIVDAHRLQTGLNSCIFNSPNPEYNDLLALLRRPGFARIHLDLLIGGQESQGWPIFHSGLLRDALGEAKALRHVSIGTDLYDWGNARGDRRPPSLRCLLPLNEWPELKHFGLRNFKIEQEDLIAILTDISTTLCSLELSNLEFPAPEDRRGSSPLQDWSTLLCTMRDKLGWQSRSVRARPVVRIGAATDLNHLRHAWVDKQAIDAFLYNGGGNPFFMGAADRPGCAAGVHNLMGRGATETDPFDESYERPWDQ